MQTRHTLLYILALTALVLEGCTRPTPAPSPTPSLPAATQTHTRTPRPTQTASRTPTPTYTPTVTLPVFTPAVIGTSIPQPSEPIGADNFERLTRVAQWGRGTILAAAFSPDDSKIAVGSAFGLAIYDHYNLTQAPAWMPFEDPFIYQTLSFSQDGRYLLLQDPGKIFDLEAGQFVDGPPEAIWNSAPAWTPYYSGIETDSPDGRMHLSSPGYELVEYYTEKPVVTVTDTTTGNVLYTISDETLYLEYHDFRPPEGCDLRTSSPYETPFGPYWPHIASFSPSGNTLTILYWTPGPAFSLLRIYNAHTGEMISQIGNMQKPIASFVYEPDGSHLLVGYADGSIQLWDIQGNQQTFGAWHFNDQLQYAEFTSDSRYLALQSQDRLEFRSTVNGSLRARFEALAYALSPVDGNVAAIADSADVIKILEIDTGRTLQTIHGHTDRILALAFSPDGRTLASSSQDCTVKLWDSRTGKFIHYFEETTVNPFFEGPPQENNDPNYRDLTSRIFIDRIEFVPATNQVIGLGSWHTTVSWDLSSGATDYVIYSDPHNSSMYENNFLYPGSFSIDADNNLLYQGNEEYNLRTGGFIGYQPSSPALPDACSRWGPVSADGRLMFTAGFRGRDDQICVLDAETLRLLYPITVIRDANWYELAIAGLKLSPDGRQLMVATTMGAVYIYQITR